MSAKELLEFESRREDSTRFLIVLSSDRGFAGDLTEHLHRAGYTVRQATATSEILAMTNPASLALVLVDPRIRDWDILRTEPALRHVILMAVVPFDHSYTEDHCIGDQERGMDGVLELREGYRLLVAKVGAYLRRTGYSSVHRGVYQVGAVELDDDAHEVKIAGRQVNLSAKPFAILRVLMREPSKVFSRSQLFTLVWGPDVAVGVHTLDVHIHALRSQLNRGPHSFCKLVAIKQVGFKLKPLSSAESVGTRRPSLIFSRITGSNGSSLRSGSRNRITGHTQVRRSHRQETFGLRRHPNDKALTGQL